MSKIKRELKRLEESRDKWATEEIHGKKLWHIYSYFRCKRDELAMTIGTKRGK